MIIIGISKYSTVKSSAFDNKPVKITKDTTVCSNDFPADKSSFHFNGLCLKIVVKRGS